MFVSSVAATFGMIGVLLSRDWHTKVESAGLPQETHDPIKETKPAAANSLSTQALILRRPKAASKDEGAVTGLPPPIPAKAGTQGGLQGLFRLRAAAPTQRKDRCDPWIPTFVGMSGVRADLGRATAP